MELKIFDFYADFKNDTDCREIKLTESEFIDLCGLNGFAIEYNKRFLDATYFDWYVEDINFVRKNMGKYDRKLQTLYILSDVVADWKL